MSANNFLHIKEKKGKFYLSERDAETGAVMGIDAGVSSSLRKAILKANEIQNNEGIEYGLQIDLEAGQRTRT